MGFEGLAAALAWTECQKKNKTRSRSIKTWGAFAALDPRQRQILAQTAAAGPAENSCAKRWCSSAGIRVYGFGV